MELKIECCKEITGITCLCNNCKEQRKLNKWLK